MFEINFILIKALIVTAKNIPKQYTYQRNPSYLCDACSDIFLSSRCRSIVCSNSRRLRKERDCSQSELKSLGLQYYTRFTTEASQRALSLQVSQARLRTVDMTLRNSVIIAVCMGI